MRDVSHLEDMKRGLAALQEAIADETARMGDPSPGGVRYGTTAYLPCPVCGHDLDPDDEMYCEGDENADEECSTCNARICTVVLAVPILISAQLLDDVCGTCGLDREGDVVSEVGPFCECLKLPSERVLNPIPRLR